GRDNVTTVVVDVHDSGNPPEPLGDRYRRIATPTVDLDDYHDPSSDTATVPMVPISPAPHASDDDVDAGRDDGLDDAGDGPPVDDGPVEADGAPVEEGTRRTWRTPMFILAVLVVLGLAAGIVVYYSGRGWFVGAEGDTVAIYRGQPG